MTLWCHISELIFSLAQKAGQLNGIFSSTGVKVLLVERNYSSINTVFLFKAGILDRATRYPYEAMFTIIYTINSNLVIYLIFKPCGVIGSMVFSYNLEENK